MVLERAGVSVSLQAFLRGIYADPSVDHKRDLHGFGKSWPPQTLQRFLRGVYTDSITSVEHASAARGQFAMMRGVRQGCPACGFLWLSIPCTGD